MKEEITTRVHCDLVSALVPAPVPALTGRGTWVTEPTNAWHAHEEEGRDPCPGPNLYLHLRLIRVIRVTLL